MGTVINRLFTYVYASIHIYICLYYICVHSNYNQGLESAATVFVEPFCICYISTDNSGCSVSYCLATWKPSTQERSCSCIHKQSCDSIVRLLTAALERYGHTEHLHLHLPTSDTFPSHILSSLFLSFLPHPTTIWDWSKGLVQTSWVFYHWSIPPVIMIFLISHMNQEYCF